MNAGIARQLRIQYEGANYHQHARRGQSLLLTLGIRLCETGVMPRPLRIEYAGARYHVMSRGDRREAIFHDDADRQEFLRSLGQACLKTGWQVHAYCLMNNHFHLVIETSQPNLSLGMKWAPGHLHATIQSAASALGSSLWRTLQGAIDRWALAGLSTRGV